MRALWRTLWRRRLVVVLALVLTPTITAVLSARQQTLYEGTSQVLLSRQNLANSLTGTPDATVQQSDPQRLGRTAAAVASTPAVAARVIKALDLRGTDPSRLLSKVTVTPDANTDLLTFRARDPNPALAARLATSFASEFIAYRRHLDTIALETAREGVQQQLDRLNGEAKTAGSLYSTLTDKAQQLQTLETLQTSNAALVRPADDAPKAQPNVRRSAFLGLLLGGVLGIGLALLWNTLDTRIRSADELGELLQLGLLGRIGQPSRDLQQTDRLLMLDAPQDPRAEAFRLLRTSLELTMAASRDPRVLGVTSAIEGEGKSTTVANLAVALALAGREVVLIDLDLRRPYVDRFFPAARRSNLMSVVLGQQSLDEAMTEVELPSTALDVGRLRVLPAGATPPSPGEFVASDAVRDVLESLRTQADIVLVDLPPILRVGDALAVANRLDGFIVVGRLNRLRRPLALEEQRVLASSPAPALGFIATGAESDEATYTGYYGYEAATPAASVSS